jgi:UPF0716 protein FxsA
VRFLVLFALAIAAEVSSLVWAGRWFGGWTYLALVAGVVLGMVVLSGRGVARVQAAIAALGSGQSPTAAIVDGALLALAGVLLIVPGFASDAVALLLLVPPLRRWWRDRLIAAGRARLMRDGVVVVDASGVGDDGVIDVDGVEVPPPPPAGRRLID